MDITPNHPLFAPLRLGALELEHRIVLAGAPHGLGVTAVGEPDPSLAVYFAERATPGGLVICAAAPVPSPHPRVPGLHSTSQANAWRNATGGVHARGGLAMAQIGDAGNDAPQWPDLNGIEAALNAYRTAAENAGDAGFDGVELLGTRGTLPERLLRGSGSQSHAPVSANTPDGTTFLVEALQALLSTWPASRVGVCLSLPSDAAQLAIARDLLTSLNAVGLAYAHLTSPDDAHRSATLADMTAPLRAVFQGRLIVSGDWTVAAAAAAVEGGEADAVGFGRAFALHADLPQRLRGGAGVAAD
jgi:N-ethylmaleimide reductase